VLLLRNIQIESKDPGPAQDWGCGAKGIFFASIL
jgi:hypothetical protein